MWLRTKSDTNIPERTSMNDVVAFNIRIYRAEFHYPYNTMTLLFVKKRS